MLLISTTLSSNTRKHQNIKKKLNSLVLHQSIRHVQQFFHLASYIENLLSLDPKMQLEHLLDHVPWNEAPSCDRFLGVCPQDSFMETTILEPPQCTLLAPESLEFLDLWRVCRRALGGSDESCLVSEEERHTYIHRGSYIYR